MRLWSLYQALSQDFSESLFPDEDVLAIKLEPRNIEPWCWKLYFDGAANSTGNGV